MRALLAAAFLVTSAPAAGASNDRWGAEIAEASSRFGIPEDWIRRVMRAESGGRTRLRGRPIVSSAGAMGLMQLMPGTWLELRALLGLGRDPFNPRDNIVAGAFYLRAMYDRFGYPGLFAAYNAGPSRYAAFLSGSRPLPSETRAYVASIAAAGHTDGVAKPKQRAASLFAVREHGAAGTTAAPEPGAPQSGGLFVELGRGPGR